MGPSAGSTMLVNRGPAFSRAQYHVSSPCMCRRGLPGLLRSCAATPAAESSRGGTPLQQRPWTMATPGCLTTWPACSWALLTPSHSGPLGRSTSGQGFFDVSLLGRLAVRELGVTQGNVPLPCAGTQAQPVRVLTLPPHSAADSVAPSSRPPGRAAARARVLSRSPWKPPGTSTPPSQAPCSATAARRLRTPLPARPLLGCQRPQASTGVLSSGCQVTPGPVFSRRDDHSGHSSQQMQAEPRISGNGSAESARTDASQAAAGLPALQSEHRVGVIWVSGAWHSSPQLSVPAPSRSCCLPSRTAPCAACAACGCLMTG